MQINKDIESEKLIKKTCHMRDTDVEYTVIKYDDKYVCDNDEQLGKYRSVVFSEPEGKLLCFSPPKSITLDLLNERRQFQSDLHVTEVIEGTMLSLFWDDRIDRWELATKGAIGANYWFYRTQYPTTESNPSTEHQKTFRKMFLDVFNCQEDVNDLVWVKELPKGDDDSRFCYNFVLQHPENHIVLDIPNPRLYLVSVFKIWSCTNTVEFISPQTYMTWDAFSGTKMVVEFPQTVDVIQEMSWTLPGVMFLNTETGDRANVENPAYMEIKALRGNNPNLHYQYLCLLRMGKVMEFLGHFPRYKRIFSEFYQQFGVFVTNTHQAYISYFVKSRATGEKPRIAKNYFMLIQRLHREVYIPSLQRDNKIIMRRKEIYKHILELAPAEILFYLSPKE